MRMIKLSHDTAYRLTMRFATHQISIPDRWLQGRCLIHEKSGMSPLEALDQAIADWQQQEMREA